MTEHRRGGSGLIWGMLGVAYTTVTIYWPLLGGWLPENLGLLRAFDLYVFVLFSVTLARRLSGSAVVVRRSVIPLLAALCLITLARALSLILSPHLSAALLWSVLRYAEAFALVWVFIDLHDTVFASVVAVTLLVVALFETGVGFIQVVSSGGLQAGTGMASGRGVYELQILLGLSGLAAFSLRKGFSKSILKLLVGSVGVVITVIRTAFVQLLIAVVATCFLLPQRRYWSRAFALLLVVLAGAGGVVTVSKGIGVEWPLLSSRLHQLPEMGGTIGGVRVPLWQAGIAAFRTSPMTGIGSGAFARSQDFYMELAGVGFSEGYAERELSLHNTVLGFLAETGVVGLAAYIWYSAAALIAARRLSRMSRNPFDIALAGTVASGLLIDWIAASSFHPITITLVGLLSSRYLRNLGSAAA